MRRLLALLLLVVIPLPSARSGEGEVDLLTDEAIPRYLSRGQALGRNNDWAKMIDILQRVIEGDAAIFPELDAETLHSAVHTDNGVLYYPARELCVKELAKLPPEGLSIYRTTYDVPAEQLLKHALASEDLDQRLERLALVFDTYLVSSFGDDALEMAADLNLSLGRYYGALAFYRRLLDVYPRDTDRDLVLARTKAAYCSARIGDRQTRDAMLERLVSENPGKRVLVEGKRVAVESLAEHPVMTVVGGVALGGSEDWPLPGGDPTRQRTGEDLPLDLPGDPYWQYGLQERDTRFVAIYGHWDVLSHDRVKSVAPARPGELIAVASYPTVRPVVHDGTVFYKDYIELASRSAASGAWQSIISRDRIDPKQKMRKQKLRGTAPMPVELVRPDTGDSDPTRARLAEAAYRWYDYGGNDVTVTNDHIVITQTHTPPRQLRARTPGGQAPPNTLSVHRRDIGRLLWAYDQSGDAYARALKHDPARRADWIKDQSMHEFAYFRGPGVVSGGILYTVAEEKDGPKDQPGGVALWAFRLSDGRVLFRTQLHHHDETATHLPTSAAIAVAGTVVYVTTNAGILAAVDALPPGRIRWIRRYARGFSRRGRGAGRRVHVRYGFNEPVVAGGKVIIATPDAEFVEAVDAESGERAWRLGTADLGDVHHIVGVSGQTLVLAGSGICAIDLQRGKVLWSHENLAKKPTWPYGRGFVSNKIAYVPSASFAKAMAGGRSYVHRYDLETGERLQRFTFDVPRLGNIICVGGRLIAANEESIMCFSSAQHERDVLDRRIAERGATSRLLFDRALVNLRFEPPLFDAALTDMRGARKLALADEAGPSEISWNLIDLLLKNALAQKSVDGLDEARVLARELLEAQKHTVPERRRHPYEAQIALVETEILAGASKAAEAVRQLQEFVDRFSNEDVIVNNRVVGVPAAARALRAKLLSNSNFREAFEGSVRARIATALKARDIAALAEIPAYFNNEPPSEESYFALAKLLTEQGELFEAGVALRSLLREFPSHPRRAEARLQLALILAKRKLSYDARRERDQGLVLLDEVARARHAAIIAELARLLPDAPDTATPPSVELPLRIFPVKDLNLTPIDVDGKRPADVVPFTVVTDDSAYIALGPDGKPIWSVPLPTGGDVSPGARDNAATQAVSAAISAARFARWVGGDLLIGDVHGITRINPRSGESIWRQPVKKTAAANSARAAIKRLGADLAKLAKTGHLNRRSPLPAYVARDEMILRIDPASGITAYMATEGGLIWSDKNAKGALVGQPSLVGQLLAVGRADPGTVEIYDVVAGTRVHTIPTGSKGRPGVLLAPPVLDPLGRLCYIAGSDPAARSAAFHVIDTRNGKPLLAEPIAVHSRYAAVLHADGSMVVFHDGSSGGDNLHFLELGGNRLELGGNQHTRIPAEDMAREFYVVRDRARLYVLTYKLGVPDEGARFFRVDMSARSTLRYQRIRSGLAFAKPVITRRYIAIAGSDSREAHVRLYDRDASKDLSRPSQVFTVLGGANMLDVFRFEPANTPPRFDNPPSLTASGKGLFLSHPFGVYRLSNKKPE